MRASSNGRIKHIELICDIYIYMCVKNSDAKGADHTRWFWIMTSLAISRGFCSLVNHDYDYDKPDM